MKIEQSENRRDFIAIKITIAQIKKKSLKNELDI